MTQIFQMIIKENDLDPDQEVKVKIKILLKSSVDILIKGLIILKGLMIEDGTWKNQTWKIIDEVLQSQNQDLILLKEEVVLVNRTKRKDSLKMIIKTSKKIEE